MKLIVTIFSAIVLGSTLVPVAAGAAGPIDKPPVKIGLIRPAIDFMTQKGEHPSWASLSGKVVVLDFWATWCAPCIQAFPKMNALKAQFAAKGVVFYSVTYEKAGATNETLRKWPLNTNVSLDNDFHTYKSLNAWGIPVVYIFDRTGRLVADLHPDDLNASVIDAVVAGKEPSFVEAKAWSDPAGAETYFRSLREKQAN